MLPPLTNSCGPLADGCSGANALNITAVPFGDGKTQAIGSGTLSHRERGAAPGFNGIEVEPGCVRVQALAYAHGKFEVWRTWACDRRSPNENGAA